MFQYACGRALSLRTGQPFRLCVDQFATYGLHNGFEIGNVFDCPTDFIPSEEMISLLGWQSYSWLRKIIGRSEMSWIAKPAWRIEPHFHYWPELKASPGPVYLHGYWQSEQYFADVESQIRRDFCFKLKWDQADLKVRDLMLSAPSLSVHVRRGDYASKKNQVVFATPGLDYYRCGIRYVRERVPNVRIFLFSDEPEWAKAQLVPEFGDMIVVRHNTGSRSPNDMRLMSIASHHLIANSSFSWWGAWLNPSKDKMVIAPRQWFVNEKIRSSTDLIPSSWVRL